MRSIACCFMLWTFFRESTLCVLALRLFLRARTSLVGSSMTLEVSLSASGCLWPGSYEGSREETNLSRQQEEGWKEREKNLGKSWKHEKPNQRTIEARAVFLFYNETTDAAASSFSGWVFVSFSCFLFSPLHSFSCCCRFFSFLFLFSLPNMVTCRGYWSIFRV